MYPPTQFSSAVNHNEWRYAHVKNTTILSLKWGFKVGIATWIWIGQQQFSWLILLEHNGIGCGDRDPPSEHGYIIAIPIPSLLVLGHNAEGVRLKASYPAWPKSASDSCMRINAWVVGNKEPLDGWHTLAVPPSSLLQLWYTMHALFSPQHAILHRTWRSDLACLITDHIYACMMLLEHNTTGDRGQMVHRTLPPPCYTTAKPQNQL